jgi:hypothetical protein
MFFHRACFVFYRGDRLGIFFGDILYRLDIVFVDLSAFLDGGSLGFTKNFG